VSPDVESPRRTLLLTFDNLGEASELERGSRAPGEPLGQHPSVHLALPRLLDVLDAHGLRATFFVEAINCELYPDAVREIAAHDHELGMHGWRHEAWASLAAEEERETLERGRRAYAELGVDVAGFRPPGGQLTPRTLALLDGLGFSWCSPAGLEPELHDRIVVLPFRWDLVDAYYLMEGFTEQRGSVPLSPAAAAEAVLTGLNEPAAAAVRTVILHPFLMLDPGWWEGVQRILELIGTRAREGGLRVAPGGAVAESMLRGRVGGA
jgi:peptidoglycan/xylan/chitin deacetylase (PgdA/CDA1 family)